MTEQELIDAGFEKQEVLNAESDNGYDYYYYIKELCDGVSLISSDSDVVIEDNWFVKSFDIPALKIDTKEHYDNFISLIRVISGCDV